jgi:5-bromo-4-chloroindolyl phosphate hydrolysis protein
MFSKYIGFTISLGILAVIIGGILTWFDISAGSLIDWLIGIASFWWLLVILTIPWNIYFDARETLNEAKISTEKELIIDLKQLNYVQKVARWSIIGALFLHLISAVALYLLAATGISNVGYLSSGLTLLLTILRPVIRGYQYLTTRLLTIKKEVKYPREDAIELRNRVKTLETAMEKIESLLDTKNPNSLISIQQQESQENRLALARQKALLEEYQAKNTVEHEQLSREAKNAIAQLSEDSQFLGHVREIIRFVKTS